MLYLLKSNLRKAILMEGIMELFRVKQTEGGPCQKGSGVGKNWGIVPRIHSSLRGLGKSAALLGPLVLMSSLVSVFALFLCIAFWKSQDVLTLVEVGGCLQVPHPPAYPSLL